MIQIHEGKMFWGQSAAGVLFVCKKTKRILLLLRSEYVLEPNTWGIVSGKIDEGESPIKAAIRESKEETGYAAKDLKLSYVYEHGDFRFYNFICYVDNEFLPKLNWENDKYKWYAANKLPDNLHFGLKELFDKISVEKIVTNNINVITGKKGGKIKRFESAVDEINRLDFDENFFLPPYKDGGEIQKRAYVSIRVRYETNNERLKENNYEYIIESFDEKPFQELSNQVLEGVRGVSTSKYNIAEWLIHRSCLIMMPFKDFVELNNAEQILYEDADYLTKNGLDIMFRIYDKKDKDDSDYEGVLGNLFPKIKLEFDLENATATGSKADLFAVCSNIFDIYNSGKFKRYFSNQGRVNSVKDFVGIILKYNKSGKYKEDYYYNKDFPENINEKELENIIRRGIVNAIKIYASESEWILKDKTLIIPNNSHLFFVEAGYTNYYEKINEYIDKYKLKNNYKINFVNYKTLEKYRQHFYNATEKRYKEVLEQGRTEVAKKIEKALYETNENILEDIKNRFNDDLTSNNTLPFQDYEDTSIKYENIFQVPEISNILQNFKNIFLQVFNNYAKSIIEQKSRYSYIQFFEEFKKKVRNIRDEYRYEDEEAILYDNYGSKIYMSSIYATYFYAVNSIDIYKYANKIKELIGSDLYRYYSKDEINFNKGGELEKTKVQKMENLYFDKGGNVPKSSKGGNCYVASANFLIENAYTKKISFIGTPYLVHAEVTGQGAIEGVRYGHAWVEDDIFVYDYSNGREIIVPKRLYYRIGQVVNKKGKYVKYTKDEARRKMLKSGHYGCWDLDTKFDAGGVLLTGGLAEDVTDEELANKYNITVEQLNMKLKEGMATEKEHTSNEAAQRKIAKDHIFEDIDYYKKLKHLENIVALPDCYVKLDRLQEVLAFQGYKIVKLDQKEFSDGGIVVGKSHSESDENGTGERFIVESTGQLVELEGGEIVINADSMSSDKKYDFEGKQMTAREIASELNHRYGGVKFDEGGKVPCGCGNKYYYGGELPSATLDSLSGGEGVINYKTSQSSNKYHFQGKKMTPRQILSKINTEHGGKKF